MVRVKYVCVRSESVYKTSATQKLAPDVGPKQKFHIFGTTHSHVCHDSWIRVT